MRYIDNQIRFSPSDLAKSRKDRDEIWTRILKNQEIEESLTPAISHADEVSDVLHDHADHIALANGHQAKISQLTAKQGNFEKDLIKAKEELHDWSENWEPKSLGK